MIFNLPINKVKELGAIFSIIDSQKDGKNNKKTDVKSSLIKDADQ